MQQYIHGLYTILFLCANRNVCNNFKQYMVICLFWLSFWGAFSYSQDVFFYSVKTGQYFQRINLPKEKEIKPDIRQKALGYDPLPNQLLLQYFFFIGTFQCSLDHLKAHFCNQKCTFLALVRGANDNYAFKAFQRFWPLHQCTD